MIVIRKMGGHKRTGTIGPALTESAVIVAAAPAEVVKGGRLKYLYASTVGAIRPVAVQAATGVRVAIGSYDRGDACPSQDTHWVSFYKCRQICAHAGNNLKPVQATVVPTTYNATHQAKTRATKGL